MSGEPTVSVVICCFDTERFRVFTGAEMDMQIHHRPVVSLLGEELGGNDEAPPEDDGQEPEAEEEASRKEEEEATPFVQNGVRFSSLFRPA